MLPFRTIVASSSFLLATCTHIDITPPVVSGNNFCDFPKYQLTLNNAPKQMSEDLMYAMEENEGPVLYLSGGGQHGAFGAGFIQQWADNHEDGLPEFSVVTGVSTGALISLAAFTDTPEAAVDGYTITGEDNVLNLFVKHKNGKLSVNDYFTTLKKGAMTDLGPFRREVKRIMVDDYDLVGKIAARADLNRKLYIAAVDLDSGNAVAFDMTQMAKRAMDAPTKAQKDFITNCMVEAVAASSSVPLAALPVFIDNRMYIDGGVRFGMFSDQIGAAIVDVQGRMVDEYQGTMTPRDVYLIINGDQSVKQKCGKVNETLCTPENPTGMRDGAHRDWNLIQLVGRVVDILSDQVYNFSEFKISVESNKPEYNFQSVKIEKSVLDHKFSLNGVEKTCAQWRKVDDATEHPIQFQQRYMKCLIDYGKATATKNAW